MDEEEKYKEMKENMNILDLCRYQSIRIPAIALCFLVFCLDLLEYSHGTITDQIGLNATLNLVLMNGAQMLGLLTLHLAVHCIKRRSTSVIMASMGVTISLILLLVKVPSNCEECALAVLQILLIMAAKFCIGFMFGLFFVVQSEFFPISVKGSAISAGIFAGLLGTIFSQNVLTDAKEIGINPFLIIGVIFLLAVIAYQWMPETYGTKPQDQVEEMRK